MALSFCFWALLAASVVLGMSSRSSGDKTPKWVGTVTQTLLLALLGWAVFGPILKD